VSDVEAERRQGMRFFTLYFVTLAAGLEARDLSGSLALPVLVSSAVLACGYRWTSSSSSKR
jgi:hypothetical protein